MVKRESDVQSQEKEFASKSEYVKSLEAQLLTQQKAVFGREKEVAMAESRLIRGQEEAKLNTEKFKIQVLKLNGAQI